MNRDKITVLTVFLMAVFSVIFFSCASSGVTVKKLMPDKHNKNGHRYNDKKIVNMLCYHRFIERKKMLPSHRKANGQGDIYSISPELFEEHLQYLTQNHSVIKMSQYLDYLDGKGDIPDDSVIIGIDDGYKSSYTKAAPLMEKYGVSAVFYLYSDFTPGGRNAFNRKIVKDLVARGFEIGCHSYTHPVLPKKRQRVKVDGKKRSKLLSDEEYVKFLKKETMGAKKYLERYLKVPIRTFAYPYGAYSREVMHFVEEAGFEAAFSVVPSYNKWDTDRYALKRYIVYNSTDVEDLKEKLTKKPLNVEVISPVDGGVLPDKRPVLEAKILDDSMINTATVKMTSGRVVLEDSAYNPATKMVTYKYKKKITWGVHNVGVIAEGKDGGRYEYKWSFVRKTPIDKEFYVEKTLLENERKGD